MRKKQPQIVLQRKGRAELERLLADWNTAQKIAKRARIVLMSADGHGVMAIMREAGVSKTTVALAGVFRRGRRRGSHQGPHQAARQEADQRCDQTQDRREDREGAPCRRHALERADYGRGDGRQPHERTTDLGRASDGSAFRDSRRMTIADAALLRAPTRRGW